MARWMVRRGARNLILLSRSGVTSHMAKELITGLEGLGARVLAPPCDVPDAIAFKKALNVCLETLPLIKSCIQGSMMLKVRRTISDDFHNKGTYYLLFI